MYEKSRICVTALNLSKKCGEILKCIYIYIYIYIYIFSHDRNIQWNPTRKSVSVARWRVVDEGRLFTYLRSSTWRNSRRHSMFCYSWRNFQCNSVPMKTSFELVKRKLIKCVYFLTHLPYIVKLQSGRSPFQLPMVSLQFFIDIIFPAAIWSWVRLSLLKKRISGIFLGVEAAVE